MKSSSHVFAFYYPCALTVESYLLIEDKELLIRLSRVLRFSKGDTCIVYTDAHYAHVVIDTIDEKKALLRTVAINEIKKRACSVTLFIPLTEKNQMEEMFYTAGQHNVSNVMIISYEKSRSHWGSPHDFQRAQKIIISGSEQAKSFIFPRLSPSVVLFKDIVNSINAGVLIDIEGKQPHTVLPTLTTLRALTLVIGPEAGFSEKEISCCTNPSFTPMRLTPTVLRSCDAVEVALGLIRSYDV